MLQVSILGLGLIGGSLGMALKKAGGKYSVTGYSRRPVTGFRAKEMGAADIFEGNLEHAVRNADIAIVATPILAIKEIFSAAGSFLKEGCIVSDVGSTKKQVLSWAKNLLPRNIDFIGGHPMAGKEKNGIEYADSDLFRGCTYCLVPGAGASEKSLQVMQELAGDIGARSLVMSAQAHDRAVAVISHVPFIVASALFSFASESQEWDRMKALASSGFRDSTRLASGDPLMYRDICLTNKGNIKSWLKDFRSTLRKLERNISGDGRDLQAAFDEIKKARDRWLDERR